MTWLLYAFTPAPILLAEFSGPAWRCTDQIDVVLRLWAAISDQVIYATCVLGQ